MCSSDLNGAKLQGHNDTGVLAVGKKADIIAIDLSKPHLYPNFDMFPAGCGMAIIP